MRFKEFAQLDEIKKGAKDSNGFSSCWTGYHASGTKKGKNGGQVRNCVKNESLEENTHSSLETDLAKKYNELAPSIEKYKDEEGADHLYKELSAIARHHGAERKFIHMCNGARNSAHMDYDTNPGHFKNWFWYLGLANKQGVAEAMSQRNRDQGAIGHGLPWKSYDDLDQLAQDISDKILTITNIVKLNSMAYNSTIYRALERYFEKYGYPESVFNRVAAIVFKRLDDEGRRLTTDPRIQEQGVAEDWNKVNHHDKTNGLSQKAVNAYRHEHPGSKLKTAVTTKPSKLKAGSKDAKRRKSFCARMSGNEGPMKKPNGKPTPKALALRRWNCE